MYEHIDPKEAGKQAAKNIVEKMGVEFQNDDITFDIIAKTVENMIFNIQSDYQQREHLFRQDLKYEKAVKKTLEGKIKRLENKVRRKYYNGMPKEVRQIMQDILESLETSCKFDRDQGYDQYNLEDPEYQRYEDLLNMSVKIKEILK